MHSGRMTAGHPVDVATGGMYTDVVDFSLQGRYPLTWERRYATDTSTDPTAPLGIGWTSTFFVRLRQVDSNLICTWSAGDEELFLDGALIANRGGLVRNLGTFQEVARFGDRYVITRWEPEGGDVVRYCFDATRSGTSPLAAIELPNGHGADLAYDRTGRLITIRQRREQRGFALIYNSQGRVESVRLIGPNLERSIVGYTYDQLGRLITATNAAGVSCHYDYDHFHRMTRERLVDGGIFSFEYDIEGRCFHTVGLDGYDEKTLRFYSGSRRTDVTDSLGQTWHFHYNDAGQVLRMVSPLGAEEIAIYDEYGRLVQQVNPNGALTQMAYDAAGNLAEKTTPLGEKVTYRCNLAHQTLEVVDANGSTWPRSYDDRGFLNGLGDPLDQWWRYEYDSAGDLVQITNPLGKTMRLSYNSAGDEISTSDWSGHTYRSSFSPEGKVVERSDPRDQRLTISYDSLLRIERAKWPDGSVMDCEYDFGGNLSVVTHKGVRTRYRYGNCGRLQEKFAADGGVCRFQWGTEPGHLLAVYNENGDLCRFDYDAEGRLIKETHFDGSSSRFDYDATGFCSAVTNSAGQKISFKRDAKGQILEKLMPDGSVASYTYDGLGNTLSATNADIEIVRTFDPIGQLVREQQGSEFVEYEYDNWSNITGLRTSRGLEARFGYDDNGWLATADAGNGAGLRFQRNEVGLELGRQNETGLRIDSSYDLSDRLTSRSVRRSGLAYLFRWSGELMSVSGPSGQVSYDYDVAGRLITKRGSDRVETFTYDPAGNIVMSNGVRWTYERGNRLASTGENRYEYDSAGRTVRRVSLAPGADPAPDWSFHYNASGDLVEAQQGAGQPIRFVYDALGRRVAKEGPTGRTTFVWAGDTPVHELRPNGALCSYVVRPGSFETLIEISTAGPAYYLVDQIGSPRTVLSANGQALWSAYQSAWGYVSNSDEARSSALRYPGQFFDVETGLHYNYFRYYDPKIARFLTPDPIGLDGGLNLYRYAPNPNWWVDPFGLDISQNAADGDRREATRQQQLQQAYPNDSVQPEQYLRGSDGKIMRDPLTGEARRVDFVVVSEDGSRIRRLEEVTSPTADKVDQQAKEGRIRANGGVYIRDRRTRTLVKIGSRQQIRCTRMT